MSDHDEMLKTSSKPRQWCFKTIKIQKGEREVTVGTAKDGQEPPIGVIYKNRLSVSETRHTKFSLSREAAVATMDLLGRALGIGVWRDASVEQPARCGFYSARIYVDFVVEHVVGFAYWDGEAWRDIKPYWASGFMDDREVSHWMPMPRWPAEGV